MTELGKNIIAAVKFVGSVHADIYKLVTTLDEAMAEQSWHPHSSQVTSGLGKTLNARSWQIEYVTRLYIHGKDSASTRRIAALEVVLSPPGYDEPICFGVAATYAAPRSPKEIWDAWVENEAALLHLHGHDHPRKLPPEVTENGFLPGATQVGGFVVALCHIDSKEAVSSRLAGPLLDLVANCG